MDTETKLIYLVSMKHDLLKEIICTPITKKTRNSKKPASHKLCLFTVNTLDGEVTNAAAISRISPE